MLLRVRDWRALRPTKRALLASLALDGVVERVLFLGGALAIVEGTGLVQGRARLEGELLLVDGETLVDADFDFALVALGDGLADLVLVRN